ncbi:MAG: hypothetical protein ACMG6S_06770, partial [Byssovorax sp.]
RRRVTEIESISTLDLVPVGKSSQPSQRRDGAVLVAAPRQATVSHASLPTVAAVLVPAAPAPAEPHSQVSSVVVPAPFTVPQPAPRPAWLVAGAAALALALLIGLAMWLQSGNHGVAAAGDPVLAAPLATVPLAITLAPVAPPPPVATAEISAAPAVSAAPARPASKPRTGPKPVAAPVGGCSPPYTIDASGIRKLKPQCL